MHGQLNALQKPMHSTHDTDTMPVVKIAPIAKHIPMAEANGQCIFLLHIFRDKEHAAKISCQHNVDHVIDKYLRG
jgi:hypothetical protein